MSNEITKPKDVQSSTGETAAGLDGANEIRIWITADGRLYFHNITAEVIELAHHIDPGNAEMAARYAVMQRHKNKS